MTTIRGRIDTAGLAQLLGDRREAAQQHRPTHARQLEDARVCARRALSALQAIDAAGLRADEHTELARIAAALADVADDLDAQHRAMSGARP